MSAPEMDHLPLGGRWLAALRRYLLFTGALSFVSRTTMAVVEVWRLGHLAAV